MYSKDTYRAEKYGIGTMDLSDPQHSISNFGSITGNKSNTMETEFKCFEGHMKEELLKEIQTYVRETDNGEVSPSVLWQQEN